MKTLTILLALASTTAFASTSNEEKICDSLYKKAIQNCSESMCEESLKDEGKPVTKKNVSDCLSNSGGDLMEGAQICAIDGGELQDLIKAYNSKNPTKKVKCDDL